MLARIRRAAVVAGLGTAALLTVTTGTAAAFGPLPPGNPYLGPEGTATMHGDAEASDSTPLPGVGTGGIHADFHEEGAACPTILQGADGLPQALCTKITDRAPEVLLLDPANGNTLARLDLTKGSLLGGVYAYLDNQDRMVTVDGSGSLLRIGHQRGPDGAWSLSIAAKTDVTQAVTGHCGCGDCDAVSSVSPTTPAGCGSPPTARRRASSAPTAARTPSCSRPARTWPTASPPRHRACPSPPTTRCTC